MNLRILLWIRKHRKQLLVHGLVVVCFILFLIFASNSLFERTQVIRSESRLVDISLPEESIGLKCNIDSIMSNYHLTTIDGWAFIDGQSAKDNKTYLVLKRYNHVLAFETYPRKREDVRKYFSNLNLDLEFSGFVAILPENKLDMIGYSLGVYIQNRNSNALTFTGKNLEGISRPVQLSLPQESATIQHNIEKYVDGDTGLEVKGWAFVQNQDTKNNEIYLVLKSDEKEYVFTTMPNNRPDVTKYYSKSNLDLDDSGFSATIVPTELSKGNYALGVCIVGDESSSLLFTDKTWTIP